MLFVAETDWLTWSEWYESLQLLILKCNYRKPEFCFWNIIVKIWKLQIPSIVYNETFYDNCQEKLGYDRLYCLSPFFAFFAISISLNIVMQHSIKYSCFPVSFQEKSLKKLKKNQKPVLVCILDYTVGTIRTWWCNF